MSFLETIVMAIVEGLTEFLPVSSTGHLIITAVIFGTQSSPVTKLFIITVQFGTILSVVILYWKRFFQSIRFYLKLFVAFIPAAVAGLLAGGYIDALLERADVVGYALILGGIFFLFVDRLFDEKHLEQDGETSYRQVFRIGLFQVLALVPGVSRSAATIVGGLAQKLNRKRAAEFSFYLAVPTMFAASAYKLFMFVRAGYSIGHDEILMLIVGDVIAFFVGIFAIRAFIRFLTNHGFLFFGYYRIVAGGIILLLFYLGSGTKIL